MKYRSIAYFVVSFPHRYVTSERELGCSISIKMASQPCGCTIHNKPTQSIGIYTSTIKSPSAVQMSKSIKQTQSVDKVYYNTHV